MKKLSLLLVAAWCCTTSFAATTPASSTTETLPSGVVIEHLKTGQGASPTASDVVKVHYRGTLENGAEFDSSFKRNEPATFPLSRVIPCWTQGVQKMKIGGKARLTCPSSTAYGSQGAGGVIPPNAKLTFEVELIEIVK